MSVPLTGDEKTYISSALEMRESGSWLIPKLFDAPSYIKPPLQFWVTMLSWKILGVNLVATFLPSVLAAAATAFFISAIVRRFRTKSSLWDPALVFAATLGTATYALSAQMEIYLCLFYAAAWWAGLRFLEPKNPKERDAWWLYLAFLLAGVSALLKSPLYSVLWVLGFTGYLVAVRETRVLRSPHFPLALLLGVVAGLAWFVRVYQVDAEHFWAQYVVYESVQKKNGNGSSPFGIWFALAYLFIPFTFMAAETLIRWKSRNPAEARFARFAAAWALPPAIFFTLHPYRVNMYLFILTPVLAAVLAFRDERAHSWVRALSAVFFLVFCALAGGVFARLALVAPWIILGFFATGVGGCFALFSRRPQAFLIAALAADFLYHAAATDLGEQDIAGLKAAVERSGGASVAMLDEGGNIWHEFGLLTVALGTRVERVGTLAELEERLKRGSLVVLSEDQIPLYSGTLLKTPGVQSTVWSRWKSRMKFRVPDLFQPVPIDLHRNYQIFQLTQ
ncbi:MAG: ArnT family glycosyltransferase [Bdellovibrionota bacterium]